MLKRSTDKCECHAGTVNETVYQWHAYRYCLTCLHSIGRNAAGNECKPQQYRAAWKRLAA